jgi:pimeloyl-ACP methyl ester carboxylesterase
MRMKLLLVMAAALCAQQPDPAPYKPSEGEEKAIRLKLQELEAKLKTLAPKHSASDNYADVAVYQKAADWILRHPEEFLTKAYYENTLKVLDAGLARAKELESGSPMWPSRKGRTGRAYRSRVDRSLQPYTVIVPDTYSGAPMRLDVVLHGRNARLNEVSFLADAEWGRAPVILPDRIELHVYGRTNNAYRWAGEADVFEALAAVKRNYKVDENRIVLRGFSMGGAGAWHIGLHYPDLWAAIEAGAGFSETLRYAKAANAPEYEQRPWTIYDSFLYARNALLLPTVGYGSIDDPQLQASTNVKEQLEREGFKIADMRAMFLVGPKIGHRFAPESKKISEEFITRSLPRTVPDRIQFVTHTTRYNKAHWLEILGLERHYDRAEVDAKREGSNVQITTKNISMLKLAQPAKVQIDGQSLSSGSTFSKDNGRWQVVKGNPKDLRKRHGLQGPIDDAFLDSFLCVRPTGEPRDMSVHKLALSRLDTFRENWDKFMRGDLPVKDDREISDADIANNNLIVFGDATSNRLIAKLLPKLPFRWDAGRIQISGRTFASENQLLVAIYPNPMNPARYIVLNSGHTFGAKEFRGTNALLYPRLGDWAVIRPEGAPEVGFFDEHWR